MVPLAPLQQSYLYHPRTKHIYLKFLIDSLNVIFFEEDEQKKQPNWYDGKENTGDVQVHIFPQYFLPLNPRVSSKQKLLFHMPPLKVQ